MNAMKLRLRSTGVKAGTAKCFQVFRTAAAKATRLINTMYGNMKRVSRTARSNVSGCSENPVAITQITAGANNTPSMLVARTAAAKSVNTFTMNSSVRSAPSCSFTCESIGTKAWEKAPSANRRRSRLGIRNAT